MNNVIEMTTITNENTSNNICVFENEEFGQVRITEINGDPWFVGKDVAEILGYTNPNEALSDHIDGEDKLNSKTLSSFELDLGQRGGWLINESGLYSLILSSKLPTAKKFKHWVTSEVLPSIRKNGGYITNQEELTPEQIVANALIVAQNIINEKDKQIEKMQPKADYFDALVDRNLLTNFRDTAKELGIKEREFIKFLIDRKYIYRDKKGKLKPYADMNNELFEIKEFVNEKTQFASTQTLITPKGRETFRLLYTENIGA